MFGKIKRAYKRAVIRTVRSKQEEAYIKLADYLRHDYPSHWSLHEIVRDLKSKQKEMV